MIHGKVGGRCAETDRIAFISHVDCSELDASQAKLPAPWMVPRSRRRNRDWPSAGVGEPFLVGKGPAGGRMESGRPLFPVCRHPARPALCRTVPASPIFAPTSGGCCQPGGRAAGPDRAHRGRLGRSQSGSPADRRRAFRPAGRPAWPCPGRGHPVMAKRGAPLADPGALRHRGPVLNVRRGCGRAHHGCWDSDGGESDPAIPNGYSINPTSGCGTP